jgi:hypothetical protein
MNSFVNLAKTCEGVLASTPFGEIVERLLGTGRLSIDFEADNDHAKSEWRRCAKAKDIAKTLSALFKVVIGKLQRINVVGRAEAAFIGGIALWLFGLHVRIPNVFDNTPPGEEPHVTITYTSNSVLAGNAPTSTVTRVESQTYFLEGSDEFWSQLCSTDESPSILVHRVPWKQCFYRTFGSRFKKLCELSFVLGNFIGSAARIYAGLAQGEPNMGIFGKDIKTRLVWTGYNTSTYGEALVAFLMSTFPELRSVPNLADIAHSAVDQSINEACETLQRNTLNLRSQCGCNCCQNEGSQPKTCLLRLAGTILRLSRLLASIEFDSKLPPTTSGIEIIYESTPKPPSDKHIGIEQLNLIIGTEWAMIRRSLELSVGLFSGTQPFVDASTSHASSRDIMTAVSWGGICGCIDALRSPTSIARNTGTIHIRPGHIMRDERQYTAVFDHPKLEGIQSPELWWIGYNEIDFPFDSQTSKTEIKAVVTERPGAPFISLSYQVSVLNKFHQNTPLRPLYLPPGIISQTIIESSGLIACHHNPEICSRESAIISCQPTPASSRIGSFTSWEPEKRQKDFQQGIVCCMAEDRVEDVVDQWIAMYLQYIRRQEVGILFRRNECLNCCAKAAWAVGQWRLQEFSRPGKPKRMVFQILESLDMPSRDLVTG